MSDLYWEVSEGDPAAFIQHSSGWMTSTRVMKVNFPCINSSQTISRILGEMHVSVLGRCMNSSSFNNNWAQLYTVFLEYTQQRVLPLWHKHCWEACVPLWRWHVFRKLTVLILRLYCTATYWQRRTLWTAFLRISLHCVLDSLGITIIIIIIR